MIEEDKLIHSSVGLGIKIGNIYTAIISLIVAVITYNFGLIIGLIINLILISIAIWRGSWLIGYVKELFDKYIRKSTFDIEDIKAIQNSNIVIKWYKEKIC